MYGLLSFLALLTTTALAQAPKQIPSPPAKEPAPPVAKEARPVIQSPAAPARPTMQKFAEQLSFLLQNMPVMGTPSLEQRTKVMQSINQLKSSSHNIQNTMLLYAADPVMRYLSLDLSRQFSDMGAAYAAGQYPLARAILRQTTQACVSCHAASANKAAAVMNFAEPMTGIGEIERAEYFAATRRHEEAMLAYEKALNDKDFRRTQPERWSETLANLMAITIRLRNHAHVTLEMCSSLLEEGGLMPNEKAMLQAWRASARAWTQEKIVDKVSPADQLLKAQALIDQAKITGAKTPSYAAIEYMRAMTLLNEIALNPEAEVLRPTSFYLSGEISQKLGNIFLWQHPEAYYEACIRARPHSPEAQRCWTALQSLTPGAGRPSLSSPMKQQLQQLAQ